MSNTASAPGKIILSGEYAVVFGHPGIAVPAALRVEVEYTPGAEWSFTWKGETGDPKKANAFVLKIIAACERNGSVSPGNLTINNTIPLGKGMGSSTALTIAIARCLFSAAESHGSPLREQILKIEDEVNPGHSGIDFAVIWSEQPTLFKKGQAPKTIELPPLKNFGLIDTGAPNEATPELVTWMMMKHVQDDPSVEEAIHTIGNCTKRLLNGEELQTVMRDHHQAQVKIGVVNEKTQNLIKKIEQQGGSAKVIGAGGRSGGSGILLAIHPDSSIPRHIAQEFGFSMMKTN